MSLRTLLGSLVERSRLANIAGKTFGGKRDMYKALGYQRELFVEDYRSRFKRNEVANRIVKALPKASWRGGAEVIEDDDPTSLTEFEEMFNELDRRIKIWGTLQKADILAGIGRYAIILIGAPGDMKNPLENVAGPEDIMYLRAYGEDDAKVMKFDLDGASERFGRPEFYTITRGNIMTPSSVNGSNVVGKLVHWTRVIHISDGLLDDSVYGEPRLECVWNRLDDLEKVAGGGSEAFWRKADPGMQFDLDPDLEFDGDDGTNTEKAAAHAATKKQIEEYEHKLRRVLFTRGIKVTTLGATVADFASQVNSLMSLISAGTGIPQRVLMGSEQAKLAAQMDRSNWDDRVSDRRDELCGPEMAQQLIDRFIAIGALPEPTEYHVRWPEVRVLNDEQKAQIAERWAGLNSKAGQVVVTGEEIRDRILGLEKLDDVLTKGAPAFAKKWKVMSWAARLNYLAQAKCPVCKGSKLNPERAMGDPQGQTPCTECMGTGYRTNVGKGRSRWADVHRAADRFRPASAQSRGTRVRPGTQDGAEGVLADGPERSQRVGDTDARESGD